MKIFIVSLLTTFIFGCTTVVPVERKFPAVSQELMIQSKDLNQIKEDAKPSEVFQTVIDNYGQYKELRIRYDAWQRWYIEQKQIFESVK